MRKMVITEYESICEIAPGGGFMAVKTFAQPASPKSRSTRVTFRPGDLVTTVSGYPVLYEVLTLERDGLVRVRGVNWAPGYSAMVGAQEIRPVTHILSH
jgi:hypothetical protein